MERSETLRYVSGTIELPPEATAASTLDTLCQGSAKATPALFLFFFRRCFTSICQPDIPGHEAPHHHHLRPQSELRSCVKVEVAVPNKPTVFVDVKQHSTNQRSQRPYGLIGTAQDGHLDFHTAAEL